MKKNTVYIVLISILLGLNLLQLGKGIFAPKHHFKHKPSFKEKAVQKLELNEKQRQTFNYLAKEHRHQIVKLHNEQTELTAKYFEQPTDSILQLIIDITTEKIKITSQHFEDIEKMLNENQMIGFKRFKKEALRHILHGNSKKHIPKSQKK